MQPGKRQSSKRYRPHVPLEQRKRTVQACVQCRSSKKKCRPGGSSTHCASCMRSGQACTFEPIPKSQDVSSPHELSKGDSHPDCIADSLPWAMVAEDISKKFNEICPENSLDPDHFSMLSRLFCEAVSGSRQCLEAKDTSRWPIQSSQPNSPNHGSSGNEPTSSRLSGNAADSNVLLSQDSFLAAVSQTISSEEFPDKTTHPPVQGVSHLLMFILKAISYFSQNPLHSSGLEYRETSGLLIQAIAKLPPYEEAESLVDTFFTYLESNWYYFDERWFRGLLARLYEPPRETQVHYTSLCLVFLVLALGGSFMHLNGSTPAHLLDHEPLLGELPGSAFYQVALDLMPGVLAAISVESVQCCLLTALYTLPTHNTSHYYTYLGLALRMAISLSLHLNGTDPQISPQASEIRTRVFWTAFCIERRISIIMGLPTMLQMRDITVSLPKRRQDLDERHPQKVDRLIAFTKLTLIMNKVLEASPIDQTSDKLDWASSILEDWKQSLPAHLVAVDDSSLRATAHLDIMYQSTWIYLGRATLLRLVRSRLQKPVPGKESSQGISSSSQKLAGICTNSALAILNWIDILRSCNRLAKFSYTDFHSCSSSVIILLLNEVLHLQDSCSPVIERGIDALRFMSTGNELAKDALYLVERLQIGIHKSNNPDQNSTGEVDDSLSRILRSNSTEVSLSAAHATQYATPDFTQFDMAFFNELEPSLLQYSSQDLALFGFEGFYPISDTNEPLWSWDSSVDPTASWQPDLPP